MSPDQTNVSSNFDSGEIPTFPAKLPNIDPGPQTRAPSLIEEIQERYVGKEVHVIYNTKGLATFNAVLNGVIVSGEDIVLKFDDFLANFRNVCRLELAKTK